MTREPLRPRFPGYFADPFVLPVGDGFLAYGTADPGLGLRTVPALRSADLLNWSLVGQVLNGVPATLGSDVWAPEVAFADGAYWMYFSAGRGIDGHHLRVARATRAEGPFHDLGIDLTPHERFAIDAHPFQDLDGTWYLFFARDVLDTARPGTHLAVSRMRSMTELEPAVEVLSPDSDWQLFEASREIYGITTDWWTLEGPSVVRRDGRYVLFFSGGSWEGAGYGVSFAVADHPLGPWAHVPTAEADVLSTAITEVPGPGHNSIISGPRETTLIAFHAWNAALTARQIYVEQLDWDGLRPSLHRPL